MNAIANVLALPELAAGEIYAGVLGDPNGNAYHLILLPGDNTATKWEDQLAWAKSIGGDLPSRVEQALLYANCHDQFKRDWYWSKESDGSGWAWFQDFSLGDQTISGTGRKLRARAVRRLSIQ